MSAPAPGWRPDPDTLEWAAGQALAEGPATPDSAPLYCAQRYVRAAAKRLRDHAAYLRADAGPDDEGD